MEGDRQTIVLVGGGRWGRVHASNLCRLLNVRDRVVWVSRYNQDAMRAVIAQFPATRPQFDLTTSLDVGLSEEATAALVINSPADHFGAAEACLRAGLHTFVEKPLCFEASEARFLIELAADNNLILAVGLHLLSASYVHHFRSQLSGRQIAGIGMRWFDPASETRYGEMKKADSSTPISHDVYPHLWSIVRALTGCADQAIKNASQQPSRRVLIESQAGAIRVEAECDRRAEARRRVISIRFEDGGTAQLDFTREPGSSTIDGVSMPPDPLWGKNPPPVMAEVKEFLRQSVSPSRNMDWPHLAKNCLDSVIGAETLNLRLG